MLSNLPCGAVCSELDEQKYLDMADADSVLSLGYWWFVQKGLWVGQSAEICG